jgi:ubiquinone/menaquinone biosynthesis C-methylase UbiE
MADNNAQFDGSIPDYYDRFLGPVLFEPFATDLATRLNASAGVDVLEIACGTGLLTRAVSEHLQRDLRITATDLNQPMLEYAQAKLADISGITWALADMSALDFPSNSFDFVICQFGLMFVPDTLAAVREVHRVLRPNGAFLFNVWDALERNDLQRIAHETMCRLFADDPPRFYEVPFRLYEQDKLEVLLRDGGFDEIDFTVLSREAEGFSARAVATGLVFGNPLITAIRERAMVEVETVVDQLAEAISQDCGTEPAVGKMQAIVITARPKEH